MTRARHGATIALGLAAALGTFVALPARAQDGTTSGATATFEPVAEEYTGAELRVTGEFTVNVGWSITYLQLVLEPVEGSGACAAPTGPRTPVYESSDASETLPDPEPPDPETPSTPTTDPTDRTTATRTLTAAPPCNGRYTATVLLTADVDNTDDDNDVDESHPAIDDDETTEHTVPGELVVSLQPPDPASVTAAATGQAVAISWEPPAGAPSDLAGYIVDRAIGEADFTRLAVLGDPQTLEHADTIDDGVVGAIRYRVRAFRPAADQERQVASAGGASAVSQVEIVPPTTTTSQSTSAASNTTSRRPSRATPARRPAPPQVQGTVPPTTVDEGYLETLDYDFEPGDEEAVVPEDANTFLDFDSPGAGILVPFAIAECLAVWAFHLRYLARRADEL